MTIPFAFQEAYAALKLERKYSAWSKEQTLISRLEELRSELDETIVEAQNGDNTKLQDEIGDLFMDLIACCIIAEEEGRILTEGSLMNVVAKLHRRKPHIFERRELSKEEEDALYLEAKADEKSTEQ